MLRRCGDQQCFNTAQMVGFTQALVAKIREVDPVRPISSGYSMPRAYSWHMEHCPMGVGGVVCNWTGARC